MEKAVYGIVHHINVGDAVYQLQSVEFEDESFFLVRSSGEVLCLVMQNEKNEWEADCEISNEKFLQILNWIKKLYS